MQDMTALLWRLRERADPAINGLMDQGIWKLADAVTALRADLKAALVNTRDEDIQFDLGDIELTLQLVADKHGDGKIGWSVFGVGGGASSERTHAVKLTLKPRLRQEDGTLAEDFTISDETDGIPGIGVSRG